VIPQIIRRLAEEDVELAHEDQRANSLWRDGNPLTSQSRDLCRDYVRQTLQRTES
jgi:hypothetical protein